MEARFWHERWAANQIGFHQPRTNRLLAAHFDKLGLAEGARIFLPLCGKTLDIGWLRDRGCRIAGVELSEIAVRQLFADLGLSPGIETVGPVKRYTADGVEIFAGDIFELTADTLGPVDAVYDRAALVALPADMRARYSDHVGKITGHAPQLLITFTYDQSVMEGPPFSVRADEVRALYSDQYQATPLESLDVPGGLKGVCPADETAWLLR